MKPLLTGFLFFISLLSHAGDMASCKGSVLQRRFALVQLGQWTDSYITTTGSLPDICSSPVAEILQGIPELLKDAAICGSSKEGAIYYSCQLTVAPSVSGPPGNSPVIESCRYSLVDQSVSCENRTVMTTFDG